MCKHCHNKYRSILKNKSSSGGSGLATCSVKGCENKADYYAQVYKSFDAVQPYALDAGVKIAMENLLFGTPELELEKHLPFRIR